MIRPLATVELSAATMRALLLVPTAWYTEHVKVSRSACSCTASGPDRRCDVGESLWRLRPGKRKKS
jgi:hypothetical protein